MVEVVDGRAHRHPAGLLQVPGQVVGEPRLPGSVTAVDGHEERPVEVGQGVGDAGEHREPFGSHPSEPRTCVPPGGRRTMKSHTRP